MAEPQPDNAHGAAASPEDAREAHSFGGELGAMGRLWLRIVAVNALTGLLDVYNMLVLGRTDPINMAGEGLGGAIGSLVIAIVAGASGAVEPVIAQAYGAGDRERASRALSKGALTAALVGAVGAPIGLAASFLFERAGVDPPLAALSRRFLVAQVGDMLFMGTFIVVMSFLQAIGKAKRLVGIVALANLMHLPLSITLVHGDRILTALGVAPVGLSLGLVGTGLAKSWTATFLALASMRVARATLRERIEVAEPLPGQPPQLVQEITVRWVLKTMAPISLFGLLFIGSQAASFALAAALGTAAVAAHGASLILPQYASIFALALGNAATIRIGWLVGAGKRIALPLVASVVFAFGVMTLIAIPVWAAPRSMLGYLAPNIDGDAAVSVFRISALFLMLVGLLQAMTGALRGAGDMFVPMIIGMVASWLVSVPLAWALGLHFGFGLMGIWIATIVSLLLTNIALGVRMRVVLRRGAVRI